MQVLKGIAADAVFLSHDDKVRMKIERPRSIPKTDRWKNRT